MLRTFAPLSRVIWALAVFSSVAHATTAPAPIPTCTPQPTDCQNSTLPGYVEYQNATGDFVTAICKSDRDTIESQRLPSGAPLWTLNRSFGELFSPGASNASLRRYRFRDQAASRLLISGAPAESARLDDLVRAVGDPAVACLDSAQIASVQQAPLPTDDGTGKCDVGAWPVWSLFNPSAFQQRFFVDAGELATAVKADTTGEWYMTGLAACESAPSMAIGLAAAVSDGGTEHTLSLTATHKGPTNDVPRSPKLLAMIPYGYGVRVGSTACALQDRGAAGMDLVCAPKMLRPGESASVSVQLVKVRDDAAPLAVRAIAVGPEFMTFPDGDLRRRQASICTGADQPVIGCAVAVANGATLPDASSRRLPNVPAPTAAPDSASVNALATISVPVLANDHSGAPGVAIRLFAVGVPITGTARADSGAVVYTAPMVSRDTDVLVPYTIIDDYGRFARSTLSVRVIAPNRPPIANPDFATIVAGDSTRVRPLDNDSDPDGDRITITAVGSVTPNIAVAWDGTGVTLTPREDLAGVFVIPYTISDGKLTTSSTITVTVVAPTPPASLLDNVSLSDIKLGVVSSQTAAVRFAQVQGTLSLKASTPANVGTSDAPLDVKLWIRLRSTGAYRGAEYVWWNGRLPSQSYRLTQSGAVTFSGGMALSGTLRADGIRVCVTTAAVTTPDDACRRESATSRFSATLPVPF